MAAELLFGDLIRELRVARQLAREEERRSTFSGRLQALKEEMPTMMVDPDQAKSCVERYYIRQQAGEIVGLLFPQKF